MSSRRRKEGDCASRVEIEMTFDIRSFCDCCESELEWRKKFVEVQTSVEMDRIKLWFDSGDALSQLRGILRGGIPPVSYLKTLRSTKPSKRRPK